MRLVLIYTPHDKLVLNICISLVLWNKFLFFCFFFHHPVQRHRLAFGTAAGHGHGVHHVPVGHLLQVRVAISPAETGYTSPEEPEAKDQGQEQARRPAALPGFHHPAQQDGAHTARVHRHQRVRHKHAHILSGQYA